MRFISLNTFKIREKELIIVPQAFFPKRCYDNLTELWDIRNISEECSGSEDAKLSKKGKNIRKYAGYGTPQYSELLEYTISFDELHTEIAVRFMQACRQACTDVHPWNHFLKPHSK